MSKPNILRLVSAFSVISLGAILGYSGIKLAQSTSGESNRTMASIAKEITLTKMVAEQFTQTIFDIKVSKSEIGLLDSDTSEIQVQVEAFTFVPAGISYAWILPEDVQILEGSPYGQLPEFTANQTQEFSLKVKGFNKLKKTFISFSILGQVDKTRIKREILLSSRPEDSFEYVVQQYENAKKEEAKAHNKVGKASVYKAPVDPKKITH